VESGGKQAVLDQPYAAARVKEAGRVEPAVVTQEEARQAFGPALAAQPARPASFVLYFLEGRDELTPESKQVVGTILTEITKRPAPEIVVIGHTDRVGPVPYNDTLSLRRAERVRDELVKAGVAADRILVAGRGEREPLVPTADEVAEPRNRRVEINVR
jgi:outer membrane protein OmpA-like peptidoglycan-associated protein